MNERMILLTEQFEEAKAYWTEKLSGEFEGTGLQWDFTGKADNVSAVYDFQLNTGLVDQLLIKCKNQDLSIYIFLLAVTKALFFKLLGEENISIASPVYNPGTKYYNKCILLRDSIKNSMCFKELLLGVRQTVIDGYKNQHYPFAQLINGGNEEKIQSLYKTIVQFDNIHNTNLASESIGSDQNEMAFAFRKEETHLSCRIIYKSSLYKSETIKKLGTFIENILSQVLQVPQTSLESLELMDSRERQQLLFEFNATEIEYEKDKTIQEIFAMQAAKTPDAVAIAFDHKEMTYKELEQHSGKLANCLRKNGVTPNSIVGILVDNSPDMIIGLLAVLKAGGAYLPLDPAYPEGRIKYMLEDSKAVLLLTQRKLQEKIAFDKNIVCIDDTSYEEESENIDNKNVAGDLAYVIYTSGSTGEPKGVLVEHRNIMNYVKWRIENYSIGNKDITLQLISFSFDGFGSNLYSSLLTGGILILVDSSYWRDFIHVKDIIREYRVTNMSLVPSMYSAILENSTFEDLETLRFVVLGGERTSSELVRSSKRINSQITLINEYGPTENSVTSTALIGMEEDKISVIGKPIANNKVYILNQKGSIMPLGFSGELCLSGAGLARGYLNRPQLTNERFVANPFKPAVRMYRTGDAAKWLPDGSIEYLGRLDHQIKVRGYRIELGEIEYWLEKQEQIKQAVVIDRLDSDGETRIYGYYTENKDICEKEIREYMEQYLPQYMIPDAFIKVDKMPLTPNGKIDRAALPQPVKGIKAIYEEPRNETEEKILMMWTELLGMDKIGINDSFFELGGHSLKAASLTSRIHREFDVKLSLTRIFQSPTIKELAEYIEKAESSAYSSIKPAPEKECYFLSCAQKRLYILNQFDSENVGYNLPGAVTLEGELDTNKLEESLKKLIKRHEALRTSFKMLGREPVQVISQEVEFKIEYVQTDEEGLPIIIEDFVRPFDLCKAPSFRAGLVKLAKDSHVLMFDMHHIISDGVSMGILIKEFAELYNGEELPSLELQYKDYCEWQNDMLNKGVIKKQEEYWVDRFSGEIPILDLPLDFERPLTQTFEGDTVRVAIEERQFEQLNKIAADSGATLYMVFLAAYNILLSKYTGQEDIVVGTPLAGRAHADLENVVGMFVNTLAMRNYPKGDKTFNAFLQETKADTLQAFENQDYQFEELVEKLDIKRNLSRNPLFDTMLSFQNINDIDIDIGKLNIKPYEFANNVSKFDITLRVAEQGNRAIMAFEYNTALFKKETIERFARHLTNIFEAIGTNYNVKISDIEILTEAEKYQVLQGFNNTRAEYQSKLTIKEMFEVRVKQNLDKIAVVEDSRRLTYKELNEKANQLARILLKNGAVKGNVIGILSSNSIEMIVGILSVLKLGGTYLPIDPNLPVDRIKYIIEDSGIGMLLATDLQEKCIEYKGVILNISDSSLYQGETADLETVSSTSDLAYVIYTSGTTGLPKGVMLENKGVVNYVSWFSDKAKLDIHDKTILLSSLCFDLGYTAFYPALLNGCELHIVSKRLYADPEQLLKYIAINGITYMKLTPSLFNIIISSLTFKRGAAMGKLRLVVLGGEKIKVKDVEQFHAGYSDIMIMNHYGPTETTIGSISEYIDFKNFESYKKHPVLGRPIKNTMIYILDKYQLPVPVGVWGYICISGDGLARGYLNQRDLDELKFSRNPFVAEEGFRLYRTGDIGRYLEDGTIEFKGRADHQVKIRGYRVELGEIESKALGHLAVKEALAVTREDASGSLYISLYLVLKEEIDAQELKKYLSMELPDYMLPTRIIILEGIPLTPNGKVDLKALPNGASDIETTQEHCTPTNYTEEKLKAIWEMVLNREKIGTRENFFELGGHSLSVVYLASQIYEAFSVELPLISIMQNPTIEQMAIYLDKFNEEEAHDNEEQPYILLNAKKKKNIFAFPHSVAHGYAYRDLARFINKASFYAFDFIEASDRIEQYIKYIVAEQPVGPYILFGYSLGGNLAFQIIEEMIKQGHKVSDLILLDSLARLGEENVTIEEIEKDVEESMQEIQKEMQQDTGLKDLMESEYIKRRIVMKMRNYRHYGNKIINSGIIDTNIHLIYSDLASDESYTQEEKNKIGQSREPWKRLTSKLYEEYSGAGTHSDMVNPGYIQKNAEIINKIVKRIK